MSILHRQLNDFFQFWHNNRFGAMK